MKRYIFFLFLLFSLGAGAQTKIATNYDWINGGRFSYFLELPNDTVNIPGRPPIPNGGIALKNGVLYRKWGGRFDPISGGDGIDTSFLSNRIDARLKYTDTALMLDPYRLRFNNYLLKSDTASMLAPYLRWRDTASLSNRINQLRGNYYTSYFATGAQYKSVYGIDINGVTKLLFSFQDLMADDTALSLLAGVDTIFKSGSDLKYLKGGIETTITGLGNIASVFGRTGAVTAQSGDYAAYYPSITRFMDSVAALRSSFGGSYTFSGALQNTLGTVTLKNDNASAIGNWAYTRRNGVYGWYSSDSLTPWKKSGANITYVDGKVGIGTPLPEAGLHIQGAYAQTSTPAFMISDTISGGYMKFGSGTTIPGHFVPSIHGKGVGTNTVQRYGLSFVGEPGEDVAGNAAIAMDGRLNGAGLLNADLLQINNNNQKKFAITANGGIQAKGILPGTDTALIKPLGINANGDFYQMNSWYGNGGTGSSYTLPIASAATLGGVKIGSGLSISGDGTLSSTATPTLTTSAAATLTLATTTETYVFSGSAATWTMPAISGNTAKVLYIINKGTGELTLSGTMWIDGNVLSNYYVLPGDVVSFQNDGTHWLKRNN